MTIQARREHFHLYKNLVNCGVKVQVWHHEEYHQTPDACFPNNWFSTSFDPVSGKGTLHLYPMMAKSRRAERRKEFVVDSLRLFSWFMQYC